MTTYRVRSFALLLALMIVAPGLTGCQKIKEMAASAGIGIPAGSTHALAIGGASISDVEVDGEVPAKVSFTFSVDEAPSDLMVYLNSEVAFSGAQSLDWEAISTHDKSAETLPDTDIPVGEEIQVTFPIESYLMTNITFETGEGIDLVIEIKDGDETVLAREVVDIESLYEVTY